MKMKAVKFLVYTMFVALIVGSFACDNKEPGEDPAHTQQGVTETDSDTGMSDADSITGETPVESPGGDETVSTVKTEDNTTTVTIEDESGNTVVQNSDGGSTMAPDGGQKIYTSPGKLPEGWPEDIPIIEGLEILNGTAITIDETTRLIVEIQADGMALQDILDSYLALSGWERDMDQPYTNTSDNLNIHLVNGDRKLTISGVWDGTSSRVTFIHEG
jgi:hypothetical protein